MTNFPTGLDTFANPSPSTLMNDSAHLHDAQHTNLNDAMLAMQVKVGIDGSTDPNSLTFKLAALVALTFVAPLVRSSNSVSIAKATGSVDGYLAAADFATFNAKQAALTFGNLTESTSNILTITGGTGAIIGSGLTIRVKQASGSQSGYVTQADWTTFNGKENVLTFSGPLSRSVNTISIPAATGSVDGYLAHADWATFNAKQAALTLGNVTEATSAVLTIVGGTGAIIGSGLTIQVKAASASQNGYLSSADWTTFNGKENVLTFSGPLSRTSNTISIPKATTSVDGYLSATDWTTFNNKLSSFTSGNLTEATSAVLTITGGTGAIIGSGLTIQVKLATTSQAGYLSSTDWNAFSAKVNRTGDTMTGTLILTPAGNSAALTISSYSLTGSGAQSALSLSGTWNTTGAPTAIKLVITDTASAAGSLLMDLQVSTVSKLSVDKNGKILSPGSLEVGDTDITGGGSDHNYISTAIDGCIWMRAGQGGGNGSPTYLVVSDGVAPGNPLGGIGSGGGYFHLAIDDNTHTFDIRGQGPQEITCAAQGQVTLYLNQFYDVTQTGTTLASPVIAVDGNAGFSTTSGASNNRWGRSLILKAESNEHSGTGGNIELHPGTGVATGKVHVFGNLTVDGITNQAVLTTGYSLTGSNTQATLDMAGTWNTTGAPTAIKLNITDTASNAASKLIDLQVGGASKFYAKKTGVLGSTYYENVSAQLMMSGASGNLYLYYPASGHAAIVADAAAHTMSINEDTSGQTRIRFATGGDINFYDSSGNVTLTVSGEVLCPGSISIGDPDPTGTGADKNYFTTGVDGIVWMRSGQGGGMGSESYLVLSDGTDAPLLSGIHGLHDGGGFFHLRIDDGTQSLDIRGQGVQNTTFAAQGQVTITLGQFLNDGSSLASPIICVDGNAGFMGGSRTTTGNRWGRSLIIKAEDNENGGNGGDIELHAGTSSALNGSIHVFGGTLKLDALIAGDDWTPVSNGGYTIQSPIDSTMYSAMRISNTQGQYTYWQLYRVINSTFAVADSETYLSQNLIDFDQTANTYTRQGVIYLRNGGDGTIRLTLTGTNSNTSAIDVDAILGGGNGLAIDGNSSGINITDASGNISITGDNASISLSSGQVDITTGGANGIHLASGRASFDLAPVLPWLVTNTNTSPANFNANHVHELLFRDTTSTLSTLTINLPTGSILGQIVRYVSRGAVTTVSVPTPSGGSVRGDAVTTLTANQSVAWQAISVSGDWLRIQ